MHILDTQAYLNTVCDMLAQGQTLVPVPVAGTSMCPFLHPGDTVYLSAPDRSPEVGDILLFRRPTGTYILHRVIGITPEGRLWLLGDSQLTKEAVHPSWVRGIVVRARRKGRVITPEDSAWQFYRRTWTRLAPVRKPILALHKLLKP